MLSRAKMHICCFTLREQNHVYLSVRDDLWPYKIPQIRLRPGLRPGPRWGSLRRSPRSPSRLGRGTPPHQTPPPQRLRRLDPRAFGARLCSDKFCLKNALKTVG